MTDLTEKVQKKEHRVHATYFDPFSVIGGQQTTGKFRVEARSKAHAIAKLKAHLEGRNHRGVVVKYKGLVKEDVSNHRVKATFSISHDRDINVHGGSGAIVAKQTFNVAAKSREHAINKVSAHLSKNGAKNISLKYSGIVEGFDYGKIDTEHTVSATYEHGGKTKSSEHRVKARTVKDAHDAVGTELYKAGATNIRIAHKGSSASFRPKPSTKLSSGSNDNKRPKVIDLAAVRARLGKT